MSDRIPNQTLSSKTSARKYAGVVLFTPDKKFILQKRENIPNITNPGKITLFGGTCLPKEHSLQCALREIKEELSVNLEVSFLKFLWRTTKIEEKEKVEVIVYVYTVPLPTNNLKLREGESIFLLPFLKIDEERNLSYICKRSLIKTLLYFNKQ